MKLNILICAFIVFIIVFFAQNVKAENIHFNKDVYILKTIQFSDINKGFENEYFAENDTPEKWQRMIGIYYYPEIKDSIRFAKNADKEIETKANVILLKFIANKKQNKAILSFIDGGELDGKPYIEHNIYKYEPHPTKGMMILRYAKRYFAKTDKEITEISLKIKDTNDDLMEQIIISPIPPIVEN